MKNLLAVLLLASCAHAGETGTPVPAGAPVESVEIHSREAAPGEAVLVTVSAAGQTQAPTGTLAGKPLAFYKTHDGAWAALAGFDLDFKPGAAKVVLQLGAPASSHAWTGSITVHDKKFPTTQLTVDDKFVKLSPADEARSEAEAKELKALYASSAATPLFDGAFTSPIPGATAARFGERRVFNGVPKAPHGGADLRAKTGEPIHATSAGKVVLAKDLFYSGNTVILDHGMGLFTIYMHMSRIDAVVGRMAADREVLGLVGATGRVTGPHLHWGVKLQGARVDPFALTALPLGEYRP